MIIELLTGYGQTLTKSLNLPSTLASCLTNYTIEDDGLRQSWQGYRVFINPPYSNVAEWVEKSYEWMYCKQKPAEIIVMLLAVRTDTEWFHRYIYNTKNVEIRFIKGRLLFEGTANTAPFPSMVVVMKPMF